VKKLFCDAVFHTGRTRDESFAYMLTENGRIIELSDVEPRSYDERVSLGGVHAYPCLIDAHMHLVSSIFTATLCFNMAEVVANSLEPHNIEGVAERIRRFAALRSSDRLLNAANYVTAAIDERRLPTRSELDEWTGGRAIMISTIDGHASALSSEAMKLLGLPFSKLGQYYGLAHEEYQGRLMRFMAGCMDEDAMIKGAIRLQNECAGYGIGALGALEGGGRDADSSALLRTAEIAARMDLAVCMYPQCFDEDSVLQVQRYFRRKRLGGCGDWEMDGAVGAHTAAFYESYGDTGETASCYMSQETVNEKVEKLDKEGYALASHAIGTAAIDRILAAYERLDTKTMHRIEHFEFPSESAVKRVTALKDRVAVTMQPGFSWIDKRFQRSYDKFLRPEQIARQRLRTLVRGGVCLCGSSDAPVQGIDPYLQMQGMTQFHVDEESISPYEAFCTYTINPAKAMGMTADLGSLETGKLASFFVADRDFFGLDAGEVGEFRPKAVYYGGERYEALSDDNAESFMRRGAKLI